MLQGSPKSADTSVLLWCYTFMMHQTTTDNCDSAVALLLNCQCNFHNVGHRSASSVEWVI